MASVYELKQGFITLANLIEDETVPDDVLLDAWNNQTDDLKDKLDNCCKYIKNVEADITGLKDEEKRLHDKRKAMENALDRLKGIMHEAMNAAGEKKLACGTFTCSIQKNPESVVLDVSDINAIPEEYLKYKDPEVDKTKLKEHLKAGYECEFAHLEQSEGLRIR